MEEGEYIDSLTALMYQGDELYKAIAKDNYHLGKAIDRQYNFLRKSLNIFLVDMITSVIAFEMCHVLFAGMVQLP